MSRGHPQGENAYTVGAQLVLSVLDSRVHGVACFGPDFRAGALDD
jgi:hypothetical protein